MKNSILMNKLSKKLAFCKDYWTILYGSVLNENYIVDRSDIDITIITQKKDKKTNLAIWRNLLEYVPQNCDLRIFELLPLYIQIDIIQNYLVIFGNPLEISEYLYKYRSIWKDMVIRINANQFKSIQEKIYLISNQERLLK